MKRSEINSIMQSAESFICRRGFHLPPFAYWSPEDWEAKRPQAGEIIANRLGWDITDFGSGNFKKCGLFLFTLRNGSPENWKRMKGKLYAEKIMVVDPDQVTPMHFHWKKMEDIINRGGGNLILRLYNSTQAEKIDAENKVDITTDGVRRTLPPGGSIALAPGESITLPPYCYHAFWGEGGRVLAGEVSMVNDDSLDNRFADPVGRFPEIEEDEPPLHYLVADYGRFE
jgi:D-lyxose ketol-isomerase